jgi:hypothetical protein
MCSQASKRHNFFADIKIECEQGIFPFLGGRGVYFLQIALGSKIYKIDIAHFLTNI